MALSSEAQGYQELLADILREEGFDGNEMYLALVLMGTVNLEQLLKVRDAARPIGNEAYRAPVTYVEDFQRVAEALANLDAQYQPI